LEKICLHLIGHRTNLAGVQRIEQPDVLITKEIKTGAERMNMWHRMTRGVRRASFAISVSVVGIGLMVSCANAALLPLAPGGTDFFTITPAPASLPTGAMIASETEPLVDTGGNPLVGSLTSEVFYDTPSSTTLDFVYVLSNTGTAGDDSFDGMSSLPFFNFTTNVGYQAGTGTVDPFSANRSTNGQTIGWQFTVNTIQPGQSTDYLIVQTNATQYNGNGEANVIDGGTAETGAEAPYLMPSVPEPASAGLIAIAGGMLLGRRRRA
jgi:hypothetical protein